MEVKNVGIVGSGQVGTTIGTVWLQHGYNVTLSDVAESVLQKARATVTGSLERRVAKGISAPSRRKKL